jgi:hypothetical protein
VGDKRLENYDDDDDDDYYYHHHHHSYVINCIVLYLVCASVSFFHSCSLS